MSDKEELERLMMAHLPRLQAILEAARKCIQAGAGIRNDDFWKQVESDKNNHKRRKKRA